MKIAWRKGAQFVARMKCIQWKMESTPNIFHILLQARCHFQQKLKWTNKYLHNFSTCYGLPFHKIVPFLSLYHFSLSLSLALSVLGEFQKRVWCGKGFVLQQIENAAKGCELSKQISRVTVFCMVESVPWMLRAIELKLRPRHFCSSGRSFITFN